MNTKLPTFTDEHGNEWRLAVMPATVPYYADADINAFNAVIKAMSAEQRATVCGHSECEDVQDNLLEKLETAEAALAEERRKVAEARSVAMSFDSLRATNDALRVDNGVLATERDQARTAQALLVKDLEAMEIGRDSVRNELAEERRLHALTDATLKVERRELRECERILEAHVKKLLALAKKRESVKIDAFELRNDLEYAKMIRDEAIAERDSIHARIKELEAGNQRWMRERNAISTRLQALPGDILSWRVDFLCDQLDTAQALLRECMPLVQRDHYRYKDAKPLRRIPEHLWNRIYDAVNGPPVCEHRGPLDETDEYNNGPICGEPATHLSCSPIIDQPVCAKHKCRCNKPLLKGTQ